MDFARHIMGRDATRLQRDMVFGQRASGETTVCEADESDMGHFCEEVGGVKVYKWFVAVGVLVRGQPEALRLSFLDPLPESRDVARVPKMTNTQWKRIADDVFPAGANIVLMADSNACYAQTECAGVVDKHQ
eukprot:15477781-Alexandrium_andersonii.AAC.1